MTNEHYLEVAKECGAVIHSDGNIFFTNVTKLSAYTARICAEKDAEIARLNSALCGCEDTWRERFSEANAAIAMKDEALKPFINLLQEHNKKGDDNRPVFAINDAMITLGDLRKAIAAISTTPEYIAAWEAEKLSDGKLYSAMSSVAVLKQNTDLQRQVAMQADKLNKIKFLDGYDGCRLHHSAAKLLNEAIEASLSTVAKWEAEKLLPLRRQVAMLVHLFTEWRQDHLSDHQLIEAVIATNTQATAEAYEKELAAKVFDKVIKFGASEREARLVFANTQDRDNFLALIVGAEEYRATKQIKE